MVEPVVNLWCNGYSGGLEYGRKELKRDICVEIVRVTPRFLRIVCAAGKKENG